MVIIGEHSSKLELVEPDRDLCGSFDDNNYVSTEDDNNAISNLGYNDVVESKQTQEPVRTNTNGVNHSSQKRNKTYVFPIDSTNLNQETEETSVSGKTAEYRNELESVKPGNAQHGNTDIQHYVSLDDDYDANDMTQKTRTTEALEIKKLYHNDMNQSNQTQKPIHTNANNLNHECQVQNHTYIVPIDNTNLNQETPRTSVTQKEVKKESPGRCMNKGFLYLMILAFVIYTAALAIMVYYYIDMNKKSNELENEIAQLKINKSQKLESSSNVSVENMNEIKKMEDSVTDINAKLFDIRQMLVTNSSTSAPIKDTLTNYLIGHWQMDEDVEKYVDDDSGNEMHGIANEITIARGKFTRARYFNGTGNIEIPHNDAMNLSKSDFSFCGWIKIESHTNPLTTFAVQQGVGCDYRPGREGSTPGWDIGHGFTHRGTRICIRDDLNNVGNEIIVHNDDVSNANLLGKWTHYVVVFNRLIGKIVLYINSKKQDPSIDISAVTGNINNDQPLFFGSLYGWKTKGFLDDYRLYNKALNETEVMIIYKDHRV